MHENNENNLDKIIKDTTDLNSLINWPENIKRFTSTKGVFFVAINSSGMAIAMAYIEN